MKLKANLIIISIMKKEDDDYDDMNVNDRDTLTMNKVLLRKDPKFAEKALSLVCSLCRKIVKVTIKTGSCVPGNSPVFQSLQLGSLQERCLYVADLIGTHRQELEDELSESVCSCLGCCGHRTCYFPNVDGDFLRNLIKDVKSTVLTSLQNDGWSIEEPVFHFPSDFHVPKSPFPSPSPPAPSHPSPPAPSSSSHAAPP